MNCLECNTKLDYDHTVQTEHGAWNVLVCPKCLHIDFETLDDLCQFCHNRLRFVHDMQRFYCVTPGCRVQGIPCQIRPQEAGR